MHEPHAARIREALADLRLGRLDRDAERRLRQHLASCARCREEAVFESRLLAAAAALRETAPAGVDVRPRVRRRLAALPRPGRPAVRDRELAWGGAAALLGLAALAGSAVTLVPQLGGALALARSFLLAGWSVLSAVLAPALRVLSVPFRLLADWLIEPRSLGALETAVAVAVVAGALMMASTITLVLGRELVRRGRSERELEG